MTRNAFIRRMVTAPSTPSHDLALCVVRSIGTGLRAPQPCPFAAAIAPQHHAIMHRPYPCGWHAYCRGDIYGSVRSLERAVCRVTSSTLNPKTHTA